MGCGSVGRVLARHTGNPRFLPHTGLSETLSQNKQPNGHRRGPGALRGFSPFDSVSGFYTPGPIQPRSHRTWAVYRAGQFSFGSPITLLPLSQPHQGAHEALRKERRPLLQPSLPVVKYIFQGPEEGTNKVDLSPLGKHVRAHS